MKMFMVIYMVQQKKVINDNFESTFEELKQMILSMIKED